MPPSISSGILPLTSFPPELLVKIASELDPLSVLALIHTSPELSFLFCVFTTRYKHELDICDRNYTALQYFVSTGVERAVVHMLEVGVDPNEVSSGHPKFQKAPLIHAIRFGHASMVSLLLRHGARVEARDYTGCWLFDNTALPYRYNNVGFSPLHVALMQPRRGYTRHVVDADGCDARELQQIVQLLLDAGADVTARTNYHHTALHIASGMRDADPVVVASLVAAGADVGCKTTVFTYLVIRRDSEVQPIHYAAIAGNTAALRVLLDAGADVEAKTHDGVRAFDLAMLGMHGAAFEMLISAGANTWPKTRGNGIRRALRNPFDLVENTAAWADLAAWFKLRGCNSRQNSLFLWARQPTGVGVRAEACGVRRDHEW